MTVGFRRITINEQEYLWKYVFDDNDCQNHSFILVKSINKTGKLIISFKTEIWDYGYCPFNAGVKALFNGQPTEINLNQPRFVAEIVGYVLADLKIKDLDGTINLDNGIEILHILGYEFEYQKFFKR